jgi:hypothetical protein
MCGVCRSVHYCDRACQKADWATHRTTCEFVDPTAPSWKYRRLLHKMVFECSRELIQSHAKHGEEGAHVIVVINDVWKALMYYPTTECTRRATEQEDGPAWARLARQIANSRGTGRMVVAIAQSDPDSQEVCLAHSMAMQYVSRPAQQL